MLKFVLRRLLQLIPILLGVSILLFAFVRALPGGPADALLGERSTPEAEELINEELGLDQPIHIQYARYMKNLVQGDLGTSVRSRQPVMEELKQRFPATVELALAAMLFALLLGIPLGILAAKRYLGFLDNASLFVSLIGISFPVFFLALLLKYFFAIKFHWFPTVGRLDVTRSLEHPTNFFLLDAIIAGDWAAVKDVLRHMVLPAIALGTIPLAIIARITRAAVLDVLNEDYVRTAKAKGLDPLGRRSSSRDAQCDAAGCHSGGTSDGPIAHGCGVDRNGLRVAGDGCLDVGCDPLQGLCGDPRGHPVFRSAGVVGEPCRRCVLRVSQSPDQVE